MGSTRGWAGAGAALLVLLLVLAVPAIATSTSAAESVCGPGGTAATVAEQPLDAEQLGNAATIVAAVQARPLPAYAATVALATAYQESTLRNLPGGDRDSIGLFQQRISAYPAAVAADPARATAAFLDRLVAQPDWATRPVTDVAADVQQPAAQHRGRYASWEPLAAALTAQLWTGPAREAGAPCPGSTGTNPNAAPGASPTPGPNGLTLTGSPAGNAATGFALAQLGAPYSWGGTGPNAWDCSGLTLGAWASAGVAIPRVTYTQATAGAPVSVQEARSGDLALIPGSDGTPAHPGHVGMVAGVDATGTAWIVEAPRTGLSVRLVPLRDWAGQIVTIRRIG